MLFMKCFRELNQNGTTICLTTHYLEEAENLCDSITIINKGKILKTDSKVNLLNLINNKNVNFNLNCSLDLLPEKLSKYNPTLNQNILSITYDKNRTKLRTILDDLDNLKITFDEINTQEGDLEDVFIQLTQNHE